jgi:CDP-diacylglycerol--inositol 3-phosphatidyltransferase
VLSFFVLFDAQKASQTSKLAPPIAESRSADWRWRELSAEMALPVYLYVPNIIGYVRIALNFIALRYAVSDYSAFLACYALSALLDAADGFAARALNQSSMFGGVLDMVTDRTATACLCVVLAHLYPAYLLHFCALITLDIFSHWAHVCASVLKSDSTHKSSSNWIVRMYYHKPILFCVCAGNEAFYMCVRGAGAARV